MSAFPAHSDLTSDPSYRRLKEHLIASTGLAYYADRDILFSSIIRERLAQLRLADCGAYAALLLNEAHEKESRTVANLLTIGESYFFRNPEHFQALRSQILPAILKRNERAKRLHIWSAGCSAGQEAYSVAILLRREFALELAGWDVQILGTDINETLLGQARQGSYSEWAFRSMPPNVKAACFLYEGKSWIIKPEYCESVFFDYHNLAAGPFPPGRQALGNFDLILCRNVLIYFKMELAQSVVTQLHECLAEGGWLIAGAAETDPGAFSAFERINAAGAAVYQKRTVAVRMPARGEKPLDAGAKLRPHPPAAGEAEPAPERSGPDAESGSAVERICRLADRGEWEQASERCEELLRQKVLNPTLYLYYALILEHLGQRGRSKEMLRRAIYLDRTCVLAHYHLGLALKKENHTKNAVRQFEIVLGLLSRLSDDHVFVDNDALTVVELKGLTQVHLEALRA